MLVAVFDSFSGDTTLVLLCTRKMSVNRSHVLFADANVENIVRVHIIQKLV